MSFEMKYNSQGQPISPPPVFEEEPVVTEQPVQEEVAEAPVVEETVEAVPSTQEQETIRQNAAQESFKVLRERAERLEQERNDYMRMLEEEKARKLESADEDLNISDDDLTEGRHYKKLQKELKQLKQEAAQIKQQTALSATEMRLKAQYSDFDRVVSKENIEALKEKYPEVALSLAANNDIYSKAVSAYTMIKNLGIVKDDNSIDTKALVHKNMAKPKPSASISPQKGDSPLSNAYTFENGLTPELKKQLWKEMNKYAR